MLSSGLLADTSCVALISVNAPVSVNDDNNGRYRSRYCKQDHVYMYTKRQ